MTAELTPNVALYFDSDAYTEAHARAGSAKGPAGLMGRQVAGKEFLDAYLTHGSWDFLSAVVRSRERGEPLVRLCQQHPSSQSRKRKLTIRVDQEYLADTLGPEGVLHFPAPPDSRFAWARRATGRRVAFCGVTHTLSSRIATQMLCDLVVAPFEAFDALICTSRAVADMVRALTGAYADYLADRIGGTPRLRSRIEIIPLGVNIDRFRPPNAGERIAERTRLEIADDEVVVLCVGRLSHHAKAHPFPVFHAAEQAARSTGKKVTLVFSGWAAHPAVDKAFRDGAAQFAPSVRVLFVDGVDPSIRRGVWHTADVFISLPDNIQETFGLVVVEAMASGLPVVGSDWNGYRDLIIAGETGLLVPSIMVHGATVDATTRLLLGSESYDRFLAECIQATTVDPQAAADALTRLVADAGLRSQMGAAGRERAARLFAWDKVIRAYEELWSEQEREIRSYSAPEQTFAGYPTAWLTDSTRLQASPTAAASAALFLEMPLSNLVGERRCCDRVTIEELLIAAGLPQTIAELVGILDRRGIAPEAARSTVAWLLKYGLLSQAT
jgi:glycosyltransferase involved in cell wall biosynthesis